MIASSIRNAFKEQLRKLDWLDSNSRQASIEKVDAIIEQVAYPKDIFNNSYLNGLYADVSSSHTWAESCTLHEIQSPDLLI